MLRHCDPVLYRRFIEPYLKDAMTPAAVTAAPLRFHPEVDDYTMSMGMDRTPGGRIWLGWFAGGDNDQAVIVLARSDDDGRSFSEPQFLLDPGAVACGIHKSAVVGNLWTAPDGRLFLFFMQSVGYFDGRGGTWQAVCENPDAAVPTWSAPTRIWHGAALNKPTVLRDGTWLLPISLWWRGAIQIEPSRFAWGALGENAPGFYPELDADRRAHLFASRDQGRNWAPRGRVLNLEPIFDEHMVLERQDGSLLMLLRSRQGTTQCESFDQGATWSNPVRTAFPNACARFFLRRLASGKALLVKHSNPDQPLARSHLTAYLSDDDGATWTGGLTLDERTGVSYPDGFQAPDGRIFIQYDYKREGGEILLAVFTEEDVAAGRPVSGETRLAHPVIRTRSRRLAAAG